MEIRAKEKVDGPADEKTTNNQMVTSILVTYSGRSKIDRPKTNAFLKIHEFSSKISHNKRSKK